MTDQNVFTKFESLNELDTSSPEKLKEEFEKLLDFEINSVEDLVTLVEKRDVISKHYTNKWSENHYLMSTDVTDKKFKENNDFFNNFVTPIVSNYGNKLDRKFLSSTYLNQLGSEFDTYIKNLKNRTDIYCLENVEVYKEIDKLCSEITEIHGKLTVNWNGKEVPLPELHPHIKSTDRALRKLAYETILKAKLSIHEEIDKRFDKLISLRVQLAKNANLKTYAKFAFKEMQRFDWGESHCFEFHNAVKEFVLPIQRKMRQKRKENLGLKELKPYDLKLDWRGRESLYLYKKEDVKDFIEGTGKIVKSVDNELYSYFKEIRDNNLLDLVSREKKAPGGFMLSYPVYEKASIFYNGIGHSTDLEVFLHELGHCFHYYLGKDVKPFALQSWCAEVAEAGSTSMEFIGLEHAEEYLSEENSKRLKENRLRGVVDLLINCSKVDEFQHWLYQNPTHTREERRIKWADLTKEYSADVDMNHYENDASKTDWQFMHILQIPFYYIDYAISEILALSLWDKYKADPKTGLKFYKEGCRLAASKSVSEIYKTFGTTLSFGKNKIEPLAERLKKELNF